MGNIYCDLVKSNLKKQENVNGEILPFNNMYDTGWIEVQEDPRLPFVHRNETQRVKIRRIGKLVKIVGTAKNTQELPSGYATYTKCDMFYICDPEQGDVNVFCPSHTINTVCHGSGCARFLLTVTPDGTIGIDRYYNYTYNSSSKNFPAGSWINIYMTYLVD